MLKTESEETKCADREKNDLKNQNNICKELFWEDSISEQKYEVEVYRV